MGLYAAKIDAYIKNEKSLDIKLERETEAGAIYIHASRPGVSQLDGPKYEQRLHISLTIELTKNILILATKRFHIDWKVLDLLEPCLRRLKRHFVVTLSENVIT